MEVPSGCARSPLSLLHLIRAELWGMWDFPSEPQPAAVLVAIPESTALVHWSYATIEVRIVNRGSLRSRHNSAGRRVGLHSLGGSDCGVAPPSWASTLRQRFMHGSQGLGLAVRG